MQVELPPLRHRRADIPELVNHFLEHCGFRKSQVTPQALAYLKDYPYPGNVRELRNILERASILAKGEAIDIRHLPKEVAEPNQAPAVQPLHDEGDYFVLPEAKPTLTPETLRDALARHHGNRRLAALALGVSERTLYRKLKDFPDLS